MRHQLLQPLTITQSQLDQAYQWLCQQRKHFPANADIWTFRRDWETNKQGLRHQINQGDYVFSPLTTICKKSGHIIHLWSAQLAGLIQPQLRLSKSCKHIKGHGGLKQCVADVQSQLTDYHHVFKTDVKHYYETIDQILLAEQIHRQIDNKLIKRYLWQIIRRTVENGGHYKEITKGISRGCPLSPLLGGLYLTGLDEHLSQNKQITYIRTMDDICILAKTRWHLRTAIKQLNQQFNALKVKQHPDKTFIGRIEKGFDFLGYHFSREPLKLADITIRKHVERVHQLYEQQSKTKANPQQIALVLGEYVKRWQRWCTAGLSDVKQQSLAFYDANSPTIQVDLSP